MKGKDFYQILGVDIDATQKEIKHAYRVLARKYHPDVSKVRNAEEKFKSMGEAYDTLKDPKKRSKYDRQQQRHHQTTNQRTNNQKTNNKKRHKPSSRRKNTYAYNASKINEKQANDLNNFFGKQFGTNPRNNNDKNSFEIEGKDIHARVMIDLEHSLNGASQQFTVQIPIYTPQGELINKQKIVNVQIPRGIKAGETIRLSKQGSPGMGAAAGDFLLEVAFNKHKLYTVENSNIYLDLTISPQHMELGAKVKVPSPNSHLGEITMHIPKNSQHGAKLRFNGHGLPTKVPGDFYVTLKTAESPSGEQHANPYM